MEQTPLPPLVSDEYLRSHSLISEDWPDGPCAPVTPTEVRNIYEAERHKTREVVQALVDALAFMPHRLGCNCGSQVCDKVLESLALAKSINIEPTPNPEQR